MIRKSIIVMLLGFSVLAMSMPVVAQQRAAVDYVVTSTTSGKGVLVIENNTESVCRFTIYSITGQVVRVLVVKPGNERVELEGLLHSEKRIWQPESGCQIIDTNIEKLIIHLFGYYDTFNRKDYDCNDGYVGSGFYGSGCIGADFAANPRRGTQCISNLFRQ